MSRIKPYVLVVEEVQALQLVLLRALRHRGVAARGVAGCDDALRLLAADERPRALLVSCPGAATCPLHRRDPRLASLVEALAEVPVVAMTTSSRRPDCRCVRARLRKPFGVGRLVSTLLEACGA